MAMKGKSMLVKFSADGAAWSTIAQIKEASMGIDGDNQDISVFGKNYINRLQGLKDTSYSLSGFYDTTDTNGQVALRTAFLADTTIYLAFLPDGAVGWEQKVKISSLEISGAVDGVVELSIDAEGDDEIAAYA